MSQDAVNYAYCSQALCEAFECGSTVCISVSSLISLPEQDGCYVYVEGLPGNKKGHTQYIGRPVAEGILGLYKGVSCVSKFVFFYSNPQE